MNKIIFMGTPEFAVPSLKKLIENKNFEILAVITAPDKPVGRKQTLTPPPIKVLAQKNKFLILQPEKIKTIELEIKNLKPDLIIICAYGKIIPQSILDIPKYGCLNVHPSLLPKHRGPSPIQWAILEGERETGVSIMLVDEKMDHGPILAQQKIESDALTHQELAPKLAELGAELLIKTIPQWINKEIKIEPQDESLATYSKIIKKEDGKINWQKSAEALERQIRAFNPWPGTFTFWQNKKLKIIQADLGNQKTMDLTAGKIFLDENKKVSVACGGGYLILEKIQLEGKKEMDINEFLKGHPEIIGNILE